MLPDENNQARIAWRRSFHGHGARLHGLMSAAAMSGLGQSLPVARRRAGREVRNGPKADLIPMR
jgi:hypothetical protein